MNIKMIKEIALNAFYLQDYITGTETGGIEPPRIIKDVLCLDGQVVDIFYTYPETCGLSDVRYHHTEAGKEFKESYLIDDGKFFILRDGKWDEIVFRHAHIHKEISDKIIRFYFDSGLRSMTPVLKQFCNS